MDPSRGMAKKFERRARSSSTSATFVVPPPRHSHSFAVLDLLRPQSDSQTVRQFKVS